MEIEDAFGQKAIEAAGTNVGGEEENELRDVLARAFEQYELPATKELVDLAVLCFVAGRTYQNENLLIPIYLPPRGIRMFIDFLVETGAPDE